MKFSLVTIALVTCMVPAYQASVSLDGRCGNGVDCPTGSCCSTWGFCGVGTAYCSGNGNTGGNGNGNGGGNNDNSQSPAPTPQGGDGNNAGSTPQQPLATTSAIVNPVVTPSPSPAPTNNNKPNGGESLFNPLIVLSGVAIVLAGYLNH